MFAGNRGDLLCEIMRMRANTTAGDAGKGRKRLRLVVETREFTILGPSSGGRRAKTEREKGQDAKKGKVYERAKRAERGVEGG